MQNNEQTFLQKLSDAELLFDTREAIKAEREATSIVVKYFREISARELYLKHACSSLFQFATEKLGYCSASAQARINAMELVVALPEVEKTIESGELSLTAAAKVQSFFRAEKKAKKLYTEQQKLEVAQVCLSKSTREVERELASRNLEVTRIESVKSVGRDSFELRVTISEELEVKIRKLKGLLAHSHPAATIEDLLATLVELGLDKFDPVRKAERAADRTAKKEKCASHAGIGEEVSPKHNSSSELSNDESEPDLLRAHETDRLCDSFRAHETATRISTSYIPASVRNEVWIRNGVKGCEFESGSGDRCGSQHALQLDHVLGVARGGEHATENLRVLCAKHNRFVWRANLRESRVREPVVHYECG